MGQGHAFKNCYIPTSTADTCEERADVQKVRPLLYGTEKYFAELADSSGRINAGSLANVWQTAARKKLGELCKRDVATIEQAVDLYVETKKLKEDARVNYLEFVSFMLDGSEGYHGYDGSVQAKLRILVAQNPAKLHVFLHEYCARVNAPNGYVTETELRKALQEVLQDLSQHCGTSVAKDAEVSSTVATIFSELLPDGNGRVDVWDAFAQLLGRRTSPVELVLYDISHGASRLFSPLLLGRHFEAIYHSSVLVFGTEFWYGGNLFENEPPLDPQIFGHPLSDSLQQLETSAYNQEMRVVRLGCTLATLGELREVLRNVMKFRYRADNYDVLTHNCNCFSDDVVKFLTGRGIPENVRRLPELVMSTPAATLLRPFLNRWLRGFESRSACRAEILDMFEEANAAIADDEEENSDFSEWDDMASKVSIVRREGTTIDMGYFDPTERPSWTRKNSRREAVKRESGGRLVRPKSGEAVPFQWKACGAKERKEIKRAAIKRLADGRFVEAKSL